MSNPTPFSDAATEPGSKTARSTRQLILDAAEEMCAERGFEALSVRRVSERAGVNIAAITYHFGGMQQLYQELFRRRADPINAERLDMLDRLEREPAAASIEAVIAAYVLPPLRLSDARHTTESSRHSLRQFLARAFVHPDAQNFMGTYYRDVRTRFLRALSMCCPHLSQAELLVRYSAVVGASIHMLGAAEPLHRAIEAARGTLDERGTTDDAAQWLIAFLSAGFAAPPAG